MQVLEYQSEDKAIITTITNKITLIIYPATLITFVFTMCAVTIMKSKESPF